MIEGFKKHPYLFLTLCGFISANVFIYQAMLAPPVLTISLFEAGKGRIALIQTPTGRTILLDTGSDASVLRALGMRLPFWQRSIDTLILSSTDTNAKGGLPSVLSRYSVHTQTQLFFGSALTLENMRFDLLSTNKTPVISLSYGTATLVISSSTPLGEYVIESQQFIKNRTGASW